MRLGDPILRPTTPPRADRQRMPRSTWQYLNAIRAMNSQAGSQLVRTSTCGSKRWRCSKGIRACCAWSVDVRHLDRTL